VSAQSGNANSTLRGLVDRPPISSGTALRCLNRVNTGDYDTAGTSSIRADDTENQILSPDRLVDIAYERGFDARLCRLDWRELQIAAAADPVLLLLRNGNVVVVLRTDPSSADQIVVFDPLYRDDQDFLLPRHILEPAWEGDAIVVKPFPQRAKPPLTSFLSALGFCLVTAAVGLALFYPAQVGKESPLLMQTPHAASPEPLPLGTNRSSITEAQADARAEAPSNDGKTHLTTLDFSYPAISTAVPTPASLATASGPDTLNSSSVSKSDNKSAALSITALATPLLTSEPEPDAFGKLMGLQSGAPMVPIPAGTAASSASELEPSALKSPVVLNSDAPGSVSTQAG
jgi:hypothetical protein